MVVRISTAAPINDPTSPYRPHAKVAHRADPDVVIRYGAHLVHTTRLAPLTDWYVADVFHFPFRSLEQYLRKGLRQAHGNWRLGQYVKAFYAHEQGRAEDFFNSLVVDDEAFERGRASGALVVETRLRDALRDASARRRETTTSKGEGVERAIEAGVLRDADVVRLWRRLDDLGVRVDAVEKRSRSR
jgi:hypothetical protein